MAIFHFLVEGFIFFLLVHGNQTLLRSVSTGRKARCLKRLKEVVLCIKVSTETQRCFCYSFPHHANRPSSNFFQDSGNSRLPSAQSHTLLPNGAMTPLYSQDTGQNSPYKHPVTLHTWALSFSHLQNIFYPSLILERSFLTPRSPTFSALMPFAARAS